VTTLHREIAKAIKSLRATLQEPRQEFAKRLGVSARTVARYELEKPPKHSVSFKALADVAAEAGREDLKAIFEKAHERFGPRQRTSIAQCIISFRSALGLTQEEFAKLVGLSPISVARYETSQEPKTTALKKLAALARRSNLRDLADIFEGNTRLLAGLSVIETTILSLQLEQASREIEKEINEAISRKEINPRLNSRLYLVLAVLSCPDDLLDTVLGNLKDLFSEEFSKIDKSATRMSGWIHATNPPPGRAVSK
jgi:transcriptional regulator with XRE-family HTH domain